MCALKDDGWCHTRFKRFFPAQCTQAPPVTISESGKSKLWSGRDEIVTLLQGKFQKCLRDFGANNMTAMVLMVSPAAAVPEESCQWVIGAGNQWRTQYINCSVIHGVQISLSTVRGFFVKTRAFSMQDTTAGSHEFIVIVCTSVSGFTSLMKSNKSCGANSKLEYH